MQNLNYPFVSCICPTYNRAKFLPYLLHIFDIQDWPKKQKELIILDDSPTNNENIINANKKDNNVRYIYSKEKLKLGKKRNMLNNYAKGEYIICFDDDDYYPPNRIKHTIQKMKTTKNILAGSSILYVYVTHLDKIFMFGPYGNNHCTNGTMAYHKSFLKDRSYDDTADKAEEKYFLKDYSSPMVQLDPLNSILVISHDSNTVDKRKMLNTAKETSLRIKNIIKDKKLINFYKLLVEETKNQAPLSSSKKFEDIEQNSFDLDAIEAGYLLITKENIDQQIKKIEKQPFMQPLINRLENIIKKMENKEIKELDLNNQKNLNLDEVISGSILISCDYVNYMIILLNKRQNSDIIIINKLLEIQRLQIEGKIKCGILTAINEYAYFNYNNQYNQHNQNNIIDIIDKDKPIEHSEDKPIEHSEVKPIEQSEVKPIEQSEDKPIEQSEDKPIEQSEDKPIEQSEVLHA